MKVHIGLLFAVFLVLIKSMEICFTLSTAKKS